MSYPRYEHTITAVTPGSPADKAGLCPGMRLAGVNGQRVRDQIDYLALTSARRVRLDIVSDSSPSSVLIKRDDGMSSVLIKRDDANQPLGLTFGESMRVKPLRCRNNCAFCFVDQLPQGMRKPLYIKDDDWRMSLMMGNYVTLTNLSDAGFARIIKRKASPLYLSVHSLEPELRGRLLGLDKPDDIRPRLDALRDNGLAFHAQIVMCPDLNDGEELTQTLTELAEYYPTARSVAVVPVGLTKHREGLTSLRPVDRTVALDTLERVKKLQSECLTRFSTRFAFAADELYIEADESIPDEAEYEDYPQIENGVGLLGQFESGFNEELDDYQTLATHQKLDGYPAASTVSLNERGSKVIIVTGTAAAPFIRRLVDSVCDCVEVRAIVNHFLGETITVAGLITSSDIIDQLAGVEAREVWIPDVMLSTDGVFLDDRTPDELAAALNIPVRVAPSDGGSLRRMLNSV
ncbi:hypothetical protein FACS1894184_07880 [Clostridia bacterium]|nr:hypothetical protein FACS1894184_07880 [Clostridia bacterium]